jgi:uncharacterized membrane protein YhiD involved in acid resistance
MLDEFQNIDLFPVTASEIGLNIVVALVCGLFIARLYKSTYRGPGYSNSFLNSIVLLTMITSLVIMVIGNNLARAFGLVGALSIIRFRTAIKDIQDIVFIFFGLSIGLAAGAGYHKIAIIGTLLIGLILFLLSKSSLVTSKQKEYLLQFSFSSDGGEKPPYMPVLGRYCRDFKVINVKTIDDDNLLELSYYVKFRDDKKSNEFVQDLQKVQGVKNTNLYFDEEEI